MGVDDALDDGEPEARAVAFGRVAVLEDLLSRLGVDTGTVVLDVEAVGETADTERDVLFPVLQRVPKQVLEDGSTPFGVGGDDPEIVDDVERRLRPGVDGPPRLSDHGFEGHRRRVVDRPPLFRQREEVADKPLHPVECRLRGVDSAVIL